MAEMEPVGASGTPTPGNGAADPTQGSPASPAPEKTAEGQAASTDGARRDFLAEMRENPEKAAEMVQRFQRDKDKADAELRSFREKLGDLAPYVEAGHTAGLINALSHYSTLKAHPAFAEHVKALEQGGSLPSQIGAKNSSDDDDEYEDPSIKALREELAARDQRIAQLEQRFGQSESARGLEQFKSNVTSVFQEWPDLTDEDRQAINEGVERDLKQLPGETVAKLNRDSVRTLVLKHLDNDRLMEAAKRRVLREQQERTAASTGGPSGVVSSGTEPANAKPTALEAFREAAALAKEGRL